MHSIRADRSLFSEKRAVMLGMIDSSCYGDDFGVSWLPSIHSVGLSTSTVFGYLASFSMDRFLFSRKSVKAQSSSLPRMARLF